MSDKKKKKKALGRGLASLVDEAPADESIDEISANKPIDEVPVNETHIEEMPADNEMASGDNVSFTKPCEEPETRFEEKEADVKEHETDLREKLDSSSTRIDLRVARYWTPGIEGIVDYTHGDGEATDLTVTIPRSIAVIAAAPFAAASLLAIIGMCRLANR